MWIEGMVLKTIFPRMFALSTNKDGAVCEFGRWENNVWLWEIELRRQVFDWERDQWNALILCLNSQHPSLTKEDKFIWKKTMRGNFTVKSFCKASQGDRQNNVEVWKKLWKGLAQPKIEVFSWQLIHERLAVKSILLQRNLISNEMALCPLCKFAIEMVGHLFFHCEMAWEVWMHYIRLWGVNGPLPCDPKAFWLAWLCYFDGRLGQMWQMLFYAISWSLWLARNKVVFTDDKWERDKVIDLINLRFSLWVKAKWPDILNSIEDISRFPNVCVLGGVGRQPRQQVIWSPPPMGFLKFNVDGSSIGKPGLAGIGGVLRNEKGEELALFSKPIGVANSNSTAFRAIVEAFIMFVGSKWRNSFSLIVESDSANAVAWTNNEQIIPWRLGNYFNQLQSLFRELREWKCIHVLREANEYADRLAKEGVQREQELAVFFQ